MKVEKRISRILELITRLESGEEVSRRSIARVLTPEQIADLDEGWKAEKLSKKDPKPKEILKYESLLRRGLLLYGKYEANHAKLSSYDSGRLECKAQSELDKALEFACDIVQIDSSLRLWLDRDPANADFGAPAGMPRVITSKSYDNGWRGQKPPFTSTKRDLKLVALSSAITKLQSNCLGAWVEPEPVQWRPYRCTNNADFSSWKF